jgi:hypothetical protein
MNSTIVINLTDRVHGVFLFFAAENFSPPPPPVSLSVPELPLQEGA